MREKYVKRILFALGLSIIAGAITFVLIRPYLSGGIPFDGFKNPEPAEEQPAERFVPYPGWLDRIRHRAFAVVIDNSVEARPQSGLEQAEVVVEMLVEGGQTRLLAIISEDDQELLGPIRSARTYFADVAREYQAVLVHAGGSDDAIAMIKREKIASLDEINGGSKVAAAFWRVTERPKPHNLYSSSDSLYRVAESMAYDLTKTPPTRPTLTPEDEIAGESVADITIFYPNRNSLVRYVYNKEKRVFERFMEEKPHLTAKGEQLTTANVIIQFVPYQYLDGDGRLQLIMHGAGKALILRDGKVIEGQWKKTPGEFTAFMDNKGNAIPLVEGPTWIEVVQNGTRVEY